MATTAEGGRRCAQVEAHHLWKLARIMRLRRPPEEELGAEAVWREPRIPRGTARQAGIIGVQAGPPHLLHLTLHTVLESTVP